MLPNFLLDPPKTLMHMISFAPELSATFSKVRHPLYGKTVNRTTKFKAHDEKMKLKLMIEF